MQDMQKASEAESKHWFWYLASCYSKHPRGIEAAFVMACEATALLIKAGIPAYSPIAHTHPVAVHGRMDPLDHGVWLPADRPMMQAAHGLIVLRSDGWRDSFGIGEERKIFAKLGKPEFFMTPGKLPDLPRI